jgi:hypothetical protein
MTDCAICTDTVRAVDARVLRCGHTFHTECMAEWERRSRTCPTCRESTEGASAASFMWRAEFMCGVIVILILLVVWADAAAASRSPPTN